MASGTLSSYVWELCLIHCHCQLSVPHCGQMNDLYNCQLFKRANSFLSKTLLQQSKPPIRTNLVCPHKEKEVVYLFVMPSQHTTSGTVKEIHKERYRKRIGKVPFWWSKEKLFNMAS